MTEQQVWTIKRLLDWTSEFFVSRETDSPRLEAEVLLAEAMDCQRIELYTRFDQEPDEQQKTKFREWVKRHAGGEPVAYLVGHREFYSLKFEVNEHVLIPRPETEHLVGETIELAKQIQDRESIDIVDVGTGSGAVAVALAKHLPSANLTAVDISQEALEVATSNAEHHDLADRITLIESDLFSAFPEDATFDFVVSNPPYIGNDERDSIDDSVKNFEPEIALFAPGEDGLTTIKRLIDEAASRLKPGGWLLFELSPIISDRCSEYFHKHGGYENIRMVKDLARLDRVLVGQRSAGSAAQTT